MLEFQKKKKIRKILYSPIVLFVLAILFIILARSLWGVYTKEKLSAHILEQQKIELQRLVARKETLAATLDYLKTDAGVEHEIRTKFRAVKEGEQVAVIVDGDTSTTSATTTPSHGFWYTIFH